MKSGEKFSSKFNSWSQLFKKRHFRSSTARAFNNLTYCKSRFQPNYPEVFIPEMTFQGTKRFLHPVAVVGLKICEDQANQCDSWTTTPLWWLHCLSVFSNFMLMCWSTMNEKETFRSFKMAVVIKCCQYLTNQKCLVLIFSVLLESTSSEQSERSGVLVETWQFRANINQIMLVKNQRKQ